MIIFKNIGIGILNALLFYIILAIAQFFHINFHIAIFISVLLNSIFLTILRNF